MNSIKSLLLKTVALTLSVTASTQIECMSMETSGIFGMTSRILTWLHVINQDLDLTPKNTAPNPSVSDSLSKQNDDFKEPINPKFVGFKNQSNLDCFFNATLALFLHNQAIQKKLLENKNSSNDSFINALTKLAESIKPYQQDRALESEDALKKYNTSNNVSNLINENGGDANETVLNFANTLSKIMPSMFHSKALSFKTCSNCNKTSPCGVRPGNAFSTNLKKSLKRAFKDDGYTATTTGKIGVDLDESSNKQKITINLQENYSGYSLDTTSDARCNRCNKTPVSLTQTYKFTELPERLLIIINRTDFDKTTWSPIKKKDAIKIPFTLDMTPYCITSLAKKSPHYELAGFIVQIGESTLKGHYICYIKKESQWLCFNDSEVTEIDLSTIQTILSGKEYKNNATPVIFMYDAIQ